MDATPTAAGPPVSQTKASRQPMLWAALAYSSGIVAGVYGWRPALWWVVARASFACAAGYFRRRRCGLGWTLALGVFFLFGALDIQIRGAATRLDTSIQPYTDGQELQVTAHVIRDGRLQPGGFGEIRQTLDVEAEQITTATGLTVPVYSGVRLSIYRPKELWVGVVPPSQALETVIATAQALGVKVVRHWEGDEFNFGGATFGVLFPPRDWSVGSRPQNNDSLVLRVSYGDSSVLLEGDAEKKVERFIALHHPSASLLKVGHHGSANATTPELMAAAKPALAAISVGSGNPFGLPRRETLGRLAEAGTRVYRTDLDGAVTFYLDGHSVTASVGARQ